MSRAAGDRLTSSGGCSAHRDPQHEHDPRQGLLLTLEGITRRHPSPGTRRDEQRRGTAVRIFRVTDRFVRMVEQNGTANR
jgi:hypothetical protein